MPINFLVDPDLGHFVTKFTGEITDEILMREWQAFLESDRWIPGQDELADLSECNVAKLTTEGIRRLSAYIEHVYQAHPEAANKVAIYAPKDLPYGLSRMYANFAEESPEEVCVFRDREKALNWLAS